MRTRIQYNKWRRSYRMIRKYSGLCEECNNYCGEFRRCFKHRILRAKSQKRYREKSK